MSISRDDVNRFWDRQRWDLALSKEGNLSNCVFCFLKGISNLRSVYTRMEEERDMSVAGFGSLTDTPCDVRWWTKIERTYGRDLKAEQRSIAGAPSTGFIGFFGASNDFSYKRLAQNRPEDVQRYGETVLPCDCTD